MDVAVAAYEVWGKPNGGKMTMFGAFYPERWQWTQKLASMLRDKGYEKIEIHTIDEKGNIIEKALF